MIAHYIDRATRIHVGLVAPDKTEDTLWYAIRERWIVPLGAPGTLVTDGEAALLTSKNRATIHSHGTKLSVRAPSQHARFIERHGAMLRNVIHVLEEELKAQGRQEPMSVVVSEAFFALNAMNMHGGATPYQAVYGRQPACLPPILDGYPVGCGDSIDGRREQRIRELALQSMIQAPAQARTNRARTSKHPGKHLDYKVGDMVDYHRPPNTKDDLGWHGPVPITKVGEPKGTVTCRINGQDRLCRLADVRFSVLISLVFYNEDEGPRACSQGCADDVKSHVQAMIVGVHKLSGSAVNAEGNLITTKSTIQERVFAQKLYHYVSNILTIERVMCIRVGKGLKKIKAFPGADHIYLVYWSTLAPLTIVELSNTDQDLEATFTCQGAHVAATGPRQSQLVLVAS